MLKLAVRLALLILGGAFVAFWVTILLVPLWRWVEAELGIEAIGHSGPAEWCFSLVYAILMLLALGRLWWQHRSRRRAPDSGGGKP